MLFASYKKKRSLLIYDYYYYFIISIFWMILFDFLPECIKIFYVEKSKAQ